MSKFSDDIAPIKAHQSPTTQNGKCFLACMHKKFGIQSADGKIDKDGSYALVDKMKILDNDLAEKMKKVTDTCSAEVTEGADECETALNIFACAQRENKVVGIEPIDVSS
ncbi:hypothetical protein ILUMI_17987 [Ignelater luminosus]|uniref:Uncharacterized protein n=1 Tax=Ignelater luminosus TaxID=2038154 RepID=A0A8K0CMA2_IGNLU|nr:hypothetical protein ILUMI_17987 [Ignelater luminosus]